MARFPYIIEFIVDLAVPADDKSAKVAESAPVAEKTEAGSRAQDILAMIRNRNKSE